MDTPRPWDLRGIGGQLVGTLDFEALGGLESR
jgi:hypothetical protein